MADPRRVVIIDPAFLGDVVFDAPLVRAIRRRHARVEVGLVVRPPSDQLARRIIGVDRVHVFDKRGADRGLSGLRRVAAELREVGYHSAIVPHPSPRSAAVARLAKIPERVGFRRAATSWMFTRTVVPADIGFVEDRLRLIGDEAIAEGELAGGVIAPDGSADTAPSGRVRVALVLGSEWATKRWDETQAVELVKQLDARFEVVLLGREDERALFAPILELGTATDEIGGDVDRLIDRLAACDLVIAGDTGPLHIARALGRPVIALFGPTPERRHRFGPKDRPLFLEGLDCRPCSDHGQARCPRGHHRCMKELTADRVATALSEIVG